MKICDLHTHSTFSDGTVSPAGLISLAVKAELSAVALTDHNTAKGLPEFVRAGKEAGMIAVPGCEFSADYEKTEVHIVGLFFPERAWKEIEDYSELARMGKRHSNEKLIEALNRDGYEVSAEEAAALTDSEIFNRSHVARVMVAKGYASSVRDAFERFLNEDRGYYTPSGRLSAITTIRFIKSYGARAVLAHPFLNLDEEGLLRFLPEAKEAGLDAIETRYSEFSTEQERLADGLADRFGLLRSGGSDFHGATKPSIMLGYGKGDLEVPFEYYESLRP